MVLLNHYFLLILLHHIILFSEVKGKNFQYGIRYVQRKKLKGTKNKMYLSYYIVFRGKRKKENFQYGIRYVQRKKLKGAKNTMYLSYCIVFRGKKEKRKFSIWYSLRAEKEVKGDRKQSVSVNYFNLICIIWDIVELNSCLFISELIQICLKFLQSTLLASVNTCEATYTLFYKYINQVVTPFLV